MVAPLVGAAAITAGASLIGGITGGKGAKAAAQTQAQTAQAQIAAAERNRDYLTNLYTPTMQRGDSAGSLIGGFLGLGGGDQAAQALATYRGSTGYQDLLKTGLGAVNANAYARGMGDSGATLKALQARGQNIADQSSGAWLSGLNSLYQTGNVARGAIAGVATNTVDSINAANQNTADARGNASLAGTAAWQNGLQNLSDLGVAAMLTSQRGSLGSSYTPAGGGFNGGFWPGYGLFQGGA